MRGGTQGACALGSNDAYSTFQELGVCHLRVQRVDFILQAPEFRLKPVQARLQWFALSLQILAGGRCLASLLSPIGRRWQNTRTSSDPCGVPSGGCLLSSLAA